MSLFQPMHEAHRSLDGRIVDYIRDLVARAELTLGDRLPSACELALQHMAS